MQVQEEEPLWGDPVVLMLLAACERRRRIVEWGTRSQVPSHRANLRNRWTNVNNRVCDLMTKVKVRYGDLAVEEFFHAVKVGGLTVEYPILNGADGEVEIGLPKVTVKVLEGGREARKAFNRVQFAPTAIASMVSSKSGGTARLSISRGFGWPCLLHLCTGGKVTPIRFEIKCCPSALAGEPDGGTMTEDGKKIPFRVSSEQKRLLRETLNQAGYTLIGEKWLVRNDDLPVLAKTFPMATDLNGYASGLCASILAGSYMQEVKFLYKDLGNGEDGSGLIHPDHPLVRKMFGEAIPSPLQIRMWNPVLGKFGKGILCPSELAVDAEGQPTIWLDWLQVKGSAKGWAKSHHDTSRSMKGEDGWYIGVLQKWEKSGRIKLSFPYLERVECDEASRKIISKWLREAMKEFIADGGRYGLLQKACKKNEMLRTMVEMAESVGIDPLSIPHIASAVEEDLRKFLWHLRQGAGKKAYSSVILMDNRVPEGTVVLSPKKDKEGNFLTQIGGMVAVNRFPMLVPSGHLVLEQIAPLSHHTIGWKVKGRSVEVMPKNMAIMNPADVAKIQGDDDGDAILLMFDEEAVAMNNNQVVWMEGNKLAFEPPKDIVLTGVKGTPKNEIRTLQPGSKEISKEALKIVAEDGMGPVGAMTYWVAVFLAQGKPTWALAAAVLVQESIDSGKRVVEFSDPKKLAIVANWERNSEGELQPKDCGFEPSRTEFPMKEVSGAFRREAGFKKGESFGTKVLSWMLQNPNAPRKSIAEDDFLAQIPVWDGNLVHFCALEAQNLWREIVGVLPPTPEQTTAEELILSQFEEVVPAPVGEVLQQAKVMSAKLGLKAFGQALKLILANSELGPSERNGLIEMQERALANALRQQSVSTLLQYWRLCWAAFRSEGKDTRERWVKRAWRAIGSEGSPVLAKLGVETQAPCHQLEAVDGTLKDLWTHVIGSKTFNRLSSPHYVSIWAGVEAVSRDRDSHLGECEQCRDELMAKAVRQNRSTAVVDSSRELQAKQIAGCVRAFNSLYSG